MLIDSTTIHGTHDSFISKIPDSFDLIGLPIFGKYKNVSKDETHKFNLNRNRTSYLRITPGANDRIPLEFEEKLLYILIMTGKKQQFNSLSDVFPNKIITSFYALGSQLGCNNRKEIIEALNRLQNTVYEFKKTEDNDTIKMKFLNIVNYVKLKDIKVTDLRLQVLSHTSKLQELIDISFEPSFLNNIQANGRYFVYAAEKLIKIDDGVARAIFMYCDNAYWQNRERYHFALKAEKIASFVPLAWNPHTNIPKIVQRIEKAFAYLKDQKLIGDYIPHIEKPLRNSWFELFFEDSNKLYSQPITNDDKKLVAQNEIAKPLVSHILEMILIPEIKKLVDDKLNKELTQQGVDKLVKVLSNKSYYI